MNQINGKTKVCGLIGNPVEHTLSPLIHNMLAEELGIDLVYVPFLVENESLQAAIEGAKALHLQGLNVTVPHKSAVIPFLDELDELAEKIGAVNTLVSKEGSLKGYNTDMTGLLRAMRSDGVCIKGKEVVILGAGGAARAVAFLCAYSHADKIFLLNRTMEKAEAIAGEVNRCFERDKMVPMALQDHGKLTGTQYVVIQASSVGLAPNCEEVIIADESFYEKMEVGYDLIYKPAETKFMRLAREHQKEAYHGLKMLLYQGIIAFELWNNVTVSETIAQKIYEQMRKECS